jgi:hypothetical protein
MISATALQTVAAYAKGYGRTKCRLFGLPTVQIVKLAAQLFDEVTVFEPNRSIAAMARAAVFDINWKPPGGEESKIDLNIDDDDGVQSKEKGWRLRCLSSFHTEDEEVIWKGIATGEARLCTKLHFWWGELPSPQPGDDDITTGCVLVAGDHPLLREEKQSMPVFAWRPQQSTNDHDDATLTVLKLVSPSKREASTMQLVMNSQCMRDIQPKRPEPSQQSAEYPGIHNSKPTPSHRFAQPKLKSFFTSNKNEKN